MKYIFVIKRKSLLIYSIGALLFGAAIGFGITKFSKNKRAIREQQTREVWDVRRVLDIQVNAAYTPVREGAILEFKPFPIGTPNSPTAWTHIPYPTTFVLAIPHGQAMSEYPFVIVENRYVVSDFFWPWEPRGPTLQLPKLDCKFITGRVAALNNTYKNDYAHWMLDVLPKIKMLQEANVKYDWVYTTIPAPASYQQRTLELLGIDISKVINGKNDPFIEAEVLLAPSWPAPIGYPPRWIVDYLRTEMFSRIKPASIPLAKKVFISRDKNGQPYFFNEDALFAQLEKIGFKHYHLEELTIDDQIHLFANADQIVAPHDECLANLVFCKPESSVVEIFQTKEDNVFCCLAQTADLRYTCIQTTGFKGPQDSTKEKSAVLSPQNIKDVLYAVNNSPDLQNSPRGLKLKAL